MKQNSFRERGMIPTYPSPCFRLFILFYNGVFNRHTRQLSDQELQHATDDLWPREHERKPNIEGTHRLLFPLFRVELKLGKSHEMVVGLLHGVSEETEEVWIDHGLQWTEIYKKSTCTNNISNSDNIITTWVLILCFITPVGLYQGDQYYFLQGTWRYVVIRLRDLQSQGCGFKSPSSPLISSCLDTESQLLDLCDS